MSTPRRFFVDKIDYPNNSTAVLEGEEFNHAKNVLRVSVGAEITLLDGSGKEYRAIVSKIEKHALSAHIVGVNDCDRQPKTRILLLIGALKGDKTELVVQKACELGVSDIGVFSSENCVAFISDSKVERLNKVAREAAKQCLRADAPKVKYFSSFKDALASAEGYENKLFACEFASVTEKDLSGVSGSTAIVIGSEGGFTESEFALAKKEYGFYGVTLGKRILRAETAAIAALSIVGYLLGELK